MVRKRSCPAVSHICSFARLCRTSMVRILKSMPIVAMRLGSNESSTYRSKRDDFPHELLPIKRSLIKKSYCDTGRPPLGADKLQPFCALVESDRCCACCRLMCFRRPGLRHAMRRGALDSTFGRSAPVTSVCVHCQFPCPSPVFKLLAHANAHRPPRSATNLRLPPQCQSQVAGRAVRRSLDQLQAACGTRADSTDDLIQGDRRSDRGAAVLREVWQRATWQPAYYVARP
jgi:hypothetical protein